MSPEHASAVRAGCNLATLPAEVRQEILQQLSDCRERRQQATQKALELLARYPGNRMKIERKLSELGDLEAATRQALNRIRSERRGNKTN